jgi:hypothetical protein
MSKKLQEMLEASLVEKGVPAAFASELLDSISNVGDLVREKVEAGVECSHAQTFLAYVQAGSTLIAIAENEPHRGYASLGAQVLDVAKSMFEDALFADDGGAEGVEDDGGKVEKMDPTPHEDPAAFDPDILK